jgi:hypothetical protein
MPFAAFAEPQYENQAVKACLDCHASPSVMGIAKTGHAKRENPDTPAAQKACESCHGPSANHSMFPMQVENLHFGKKSTTEPRVQNEVCIECHRKGAEEAEKAWRASAHGFENVLCSTCHSIHDPTKISPAKEIVSSGCSMAGCHATLMGGAEPTSFSHAVGRAIGNKGQLTCTGCHNPHGPLNSERCADCHPQSKELLSKQSEKARRFHEVATQRGTDCVRCHKALSHPIKPLQLDEQNQTMEDSATPRAGSGG